ncbi:MAG: PAS domain S-box protein, partial [Thermodesulfobacteriota bacterium]
MDQAMELNPDYEALKQKVTELEKKIKEYEQNEAKQNFQEMTKRLEKIAEMGDDGIIVFDEGYRIEFANNVASELTGYSREKLVGMDFRRLLSERDIGYLAQMHSEVGADESKRVCTEMEVVTDKDLKRDADVCITIAKKEKGGVQTYAYLRDITDRKRMEREIREATKRFEKIAEMGEDGIIVFDEDSRIEFVNQMASEIMGLPKDQMLGREFFSLIGKRDEEFLEEMVMRGEGLGEKVCTEMSLHAPEGKIKETEVCIAPTQSEDGRIKTYAYIRDITERKKFEKALRESEEKYRNLFERVRHGLYISAKGGYFVDCNQAMWGLLGYRDKEEFLKIDIARDLYVNPNDRETFMALVEKEGFVKDFEVEWKKNNGEKITVLLASSAKKDEKGTIIGYEGLNIDITDRKKMERELKEANDFLRNLIESSVDGIIVTDMKGDILIFNKGAENLLGYTSEEVVEKMNIRSIYQPGVAKEVMDKLRSPDFGGVGKLTSFPIFHKRKNGELIEGDLSASIIYDEKGNEIASVGIFKDLRERLRIERELQKMQEALLQSEKLAAMGRLTSQIAHELNNPIYGIMNTLELLKTEIPPESKRRRILELSLSEIQRLSEMLRNMLSFSKPEEEKRRPVRIDDLIEGILLVMEKQMRESNIQVETS